MTRGAGARRGLVTAVLAGALGVASLSPAWPSGATPPVSPAPSAATVREAIAAENHTTDPAHPARAVLIVHTDDRHSSLASTMTRARAAGAGLRHEFASADSFSVQVDSSHEQAEISRLRALPGVTGIERSVPRQLFDTPAPDDPNDPDFVDQRAYYDAVNAPQAWALQKGSASIRIAILDTGIDVAQPDLAGKIVGTYNAATGGALIPDTIGHGTFVAGVAAAATDNLLGVAGAGYDTSLLGVNISSADGGLPIDDEIAGIRWAVAHGANVINLSLGGSQPSASERSAVEDAIAKGVVVVAAAGNEGNRVKQYPAAYPGVIAVGATDPTRHDRSGFSSYGPWVTVGAPGVDLYSTTPIGGSEDFPGTSGYGIGDGTSFSAPLVAGEAALIEAQDPSLGVSGVRRVIVDSAHGYQHSGLGAGQVDFARALELIPPSTTPVVVGETGLSGEVSLTATSSAPMVAFRIDSGPLMSPSDVANGVATTTTPSYGLANGTHIVTAYDCSSGGVCAKDGTKAAFALENSAPVLTSPSDGANESGLFTVTGQHDGGAARLFVDGRPAGFAASSPYRFTVDGSALTDGSHTLQLALCAPDGSRCDGPRSAAETIGVTSLHPSIASLTPRAISPNGDGRDDRATMTFDLPGAETVRVETVDAAGTVVHTANLGELDAGTHTWTWRGTGRGAVRAPDGDYTLAVTSSSTDSSGSTLHGYASTSGVVDTRAPGLRDVTSPERTFYPVRDGYRDSFTPRVALSGNAELALVITNAAGRRVRELRGYRRTGEVSLTWHGDDNRGRRVPPGSYRYWYRATDEAGNTSRTRTFAVAVSGERLVHRVVPIVRRGATTAVTVATDRSCASASRRHSSFRHGIRLANTCGRRSGDLVYATYRLTLPAAVRYRDVTLSVLGRSHERPSQLTAAFTRSGGGIETVGDTTIRRPGTHWFALATVPVAGVVTQGRHVRFSVVLTSAYPGHDDFDLRDVRLRVHVIRLG